MFDYLILNGQVIDGTGSPAYRADVGVANGRIAAIGDLKTAPARTAIDAAGKYVTPGFIDIHRHADAAVFRPGFGELELKPGEMKLIVNRAPGGVLTPGVQEEIEKYGLELIGVLPQDDLVFEYDCDGKPSSQVPESAPVKQALHEIMRKLGL